jgi:hypothetical protein
MRDFLLAVLVSFPTLVMAQNPAPQSARQALIEMFFGTAPNHLERHLPDVTRKSFSRLNSSESQNFLAELSSLSSQIKASGAKIETFDTGPTILTVADKAPQDLERMEATVERDDLVGDEDEIELALHLPQELRDQALPITPHIMFEMKTEGDVWRLTDISVMVKFPLADPDFLKTIEDRQRKKNEQMTVWAMRTIVAEEESYHSRRGSYACSLAGLADANKPGPGGGAFFDPELATGKKGGYVFAISGCDALHYKAVAEPALEDTGQRAFCTDERGTIRASSDGRATTCLASGEELDPKLNPQYGLGSAD